MRWRRCPASRRSVPPRATRTRASKSASPGAPTSTPPPSRCATSSTRCARNCPRPRIACGCGWPRPPTRRCSRCASRPTRTCPRNTTCWIATSRNPSSASTAWRASSSPASRRARCASWSTRAASRRTASTCASWCSCSRRATSRWVPARSPAIGERLLVRPLGEFRSLDEIRNLDHQGNVHVGDVASRGARQPRDPAAPSPRRPSGRRPRRVQVHAGERRRSGRPRARRHREEQGAAADAGHQRVRHRQPGRGHPHLAVRSHRSRADRRRARLRGVVHVPAALAHDADRQRRGAAVAAGHAGGDVLRSASPSTSCR